MTIKVFFDPHQSVANNKSFSPSAGKPALVVEEWRRRGFAFELAPVEPVIRSDFYLVHEKHHVNEVLDLKRVNGFNNKLPEVAQALYWTNGSMVTASLHALRTGQNTCSPTSGFHHAGWAAVDGFCTFNGLMLAAVKLSEILGGTHDTRKVGILDIDMHIGNGTENIIKRCNFGYFIHHYSFGIHEGPLTEFWKGGPAAEDWIKRLPQIVESFKDCAVVLYQAGADPHFEDPFGGALTDAQLRKRDEIVFDMLKRMNIPVAWNLAGGYQEPFQKVLDIHSATLEECLKVM
jgi:acetoin utilization deacetylase AcuC-like enzyme